MALFDPAIFDPALFDTEDTAPYEPPPPPDPTNPPSSTTDANSLFDGTLKIMVGTLNVTAAVLPSLTWSTTSPGGFGECQFQLPGDSPVWAYSPYHAQVVKGAAVTITHGATPVTLFEGEITNDVSHAVIDGGFAYFDVTAAGLWWRAGMRKDFCHVWGDDDPRQWFELNSGGVFQVDTDGKVEIRFEAGQTAKSGASKSLYYWLDGGMGNSGAEISQIIGLVSGLVTDKDSAAWHAAIFTSDSPWGTWTSLRAWDNEAIAAGTILTTSPPAGTKALKLSLYVDGAASTGTTADRYIRLYSFSILTDLIDAGSIDDISLASPAVISTQLDHGLSAGDRIFISNSDSDPVIDGWRTVASTPTASTLTCTDTNVTSSAGNLGTLWSAQRVDEAMAAIAGNDTSLTTNLAASADLQTGGIGGINWGINVRPHMSRADAIEMLAANYPDPIDYGFWDGGIFYCKERPASPPANNDYIINTDAPGIDFDVFANTEDSPTVVCVLYKFRDVDGGTSPYPDGTLRAVYRDVNGAFTGDWSDASVVLDVWDQWADLSLETGQAEDIGDQILDWIAYNKYVGTIAIASRTVPLRAGGTKTTAYIRAGDYVQDAMATMARSMITSTVVDVDSGVVTLGIGETRNEFVARISARRGPFPRGHNPLTDKGDPLTKLAGPFSPALYGRPVR